MNAGLVRASLRRLLRRSAGSPAFQFSELTFRIFTASLRPWKLLLAAPDARHAVVFDDVEELDLDGLDCAWSPGAEPLVKMTRTRAATIRGCRPQVPKGVFLKLEGQENAGIALLANDLRQAGKWLEAEPDAARDAVAQAGNLIA